ncbi:MAG: hypothetical protein ABIR94_10860 [Rubrivivax sp.]
MSLLLAAAATWAAPPQTVYRCGPDGRQYSQTPCADGREVTTEDSRSAEQQRAAREVSARDAQQADKLAAERKAREAAAKGQSEAGFKTSDAQAPPASAPKRKATAQAKAQDPNMSPAMRAPAAKTK